jgi:hypothetical protein
MRNVILIALSLLMLPLRIIAQTGGPGQPEFMQFQQAGISDLVNPSTGSFSYQIPLYTIGGYPMNLTYQSGMQMEDVSSMVGLGWNLNAGSIVRTLRALPDDFNEDEIIKQFSLKPNETYGGKIGVDLEIAGMPKGKGLNVGAGMGIFYNTYKGWGLEPSLRGSLSASYNCNSFVTASPSLGMGVSVNSQSGVDKYISPSMGLKLGKGDDKLSLSLGKTWSVNSTQGLKTSFNVGLSFVRYRNDVTQNDVVDGNKVSSRGTDQSSLPLLSYSSTSYLNNSFQAEIDYPFENVSGTYSGSVGWDAYFVDPNLRLTGYFSKQTLSTKTLSFPAVGLMYENDLIKPESLRDLIRDKKLPYYSGESKVLPVPFKAPDIFNLNAQGLSMTFSVSKNDIGKIGDPLMNTISKGTQAGIEANLGNLFKAGGNFGTSRSNSSSKTWSVPLPFLKFKDIQSAERFNNKNYLYQQFSFKNHGEINKFDNTLFSTLGKFSAVKFDLISEQYVSNVLSNGNPVRDLLLFNNSQTIRQTDINYLTAGEAANIGFDKSINYFSFNDLGVINKPRVDSIRKSHHLSEINVTQPDGMKYIFGIPVYNTVQKEYTFNVGENPNVTCSENTVSYTAADKSTDNTKGIDGFFECTTTPAYVTQFLITAVLSPNYRDITNNGISSDDVGNYVKFNYYREDFLYDWRTPYDELKATYNQALRSDNKDDKGNIVYGIKELFYVNSVESKTEIAIYHYSERVDGYGVKGENGGKATNKFLRKLDSISIFSKSDIESRSDLAIPLKTVRFFYDESLCKGIKNGKNSSTGKLTLKKVSFTYERSRKGNLSPYLFEYGNSGSGIVNPGYNPRSVNRWGYYQENKGLSDCNNSSALSNVDFPYSSQVKSEMDENAYAWNLTNITIPGGGKIKIRYEAHDYAYIQNQTAGQMFKIDHIGDLPPGNLLYNGENSFNRIYFKLTSPAATNEELFHKYIKDIYGKFLYYKFFVKLKSDNSNPNANYEYIPGYAKINDYGVDGDLGYVDLTEANLDDERPNGPCNPILKTALQFMRINRNSLIYDEFPSIPPANINSFAEQLPTIYSQLTKQIESDATGVNKFCMRELYCKEVNLEKSFIRLYNPFKKKIAGGSRVYEVSIDDNFQSMTNITQSSKQYTTNYYYTTEEKDPATGNEIEISSGVADYEPMMGGDEISLKQPVFYSDVKKKAPDNDYYVEEPLNESLFPAPSIVYSKVTQVSNKNDNGVSKTGKIVNEYFTAKDYPVITDRTEVDEKRDKTNFDAVQNPIIAIDQQHDYATVSQGYSIVLNNMSGKPKATWVYNENNERISGEEMEYYPDNESFTSIDNTGTIHRNVRMGLSAEYTIDCRESYDESETNIGQINVNTAALGVIPALVVMPLFSRMTEEKLFQSIVINKVIHINKLLKSKTVYEQTARVVTENLAFDEITGEALLTKTTNEFSDTLYSFKYPAYWMHSGMGPSYENSKLKLSGPGLDQFVKRGDELRDVTSTTGKRLWALSTNSFVDENNVTTPPNLNYQVYNSGAKNQLTPGAGQVVTWNSNPLDHEDIIKFDKNSILNSNAIEYSNSSVIFCDTCSLLSRRLNKNNFLTGEEGNWKPLRTWFHLKDRTSNNLTSGITDIRKDGLFESYTDFWFTNGSSWEIKPLNWEWKEKVNLSDVDGNTIETEDRIHRKNASIFGYKNTLTIAQVSNSSYNEAHYDGFEDYNFAYCGDTLTYGDSLTNVDNLHRVTNIRGSDIFISNTKSHTGRHSLQVTSSFEFTVKPDKWIDTTIVCKGGFYPEAGKKYVFSCWVKDDKAKPILTCKDVSVQISGVKESSLRLRPSGPVIEEWQLITGTFTPVGSNVNFTLKKGIGVTYFDDLRIFPAEGNMVSYVYDDLDLKLTNILDENNYFTKYEYDKNKELIRIKKETEKGIITMQEGYKSLVKQRPGEVPPPM